MKNQCLVYALFMAFAVFFAPDSSYGQENPDSSKVVIETADGNEYIGVILMQNSQSIVLKTDNIGEITLPKSTVVSIRPVKNGEIKDGQYWFENPYATTRYFYNPSGYGLPAGEGYYQNTWILLNQLSIGITDNVSIGVGMIPVFLFTLGSGGSSTPIWFTPKVSIPVEKDKVNIGLGALYATVLGEGSGGAGILYGTSTFGPKDKNASIGFGWGYTTDDGISKKPTISFSYIHRKKPKWAFLTENYFISAGDEAFLILSGGARYLGKTISIDFGGFTFIVTGGGQEILPILPWLSFTVPLKFGNN